MYSRNEEWGWWDGAGCRVAHAFMCIYSNAVGVTVRNIGMVIGEGL